MEEISNHEREQIDKELDRLNKEIWELKQKVGKLEIYINFKSLREEFDSWSK